MKRYSTTKQFVFRDVSYIRSKHFERTPQPNGDIAFFFGDTTVIAKEVHGQNTTHLIPVRGDQVAYGSWYDLSEPELEQYCALLQEAINK